MKHSVLVLLLAGLARAGDFELSPVSDDWEAMKPDRPTVKAFLRTEFADSDPKATAEVRVMTLPLSDMLAKKEVDAIARDWAPEMEEPFKEPRRVAEAAAKLGGRDAWSRDVRTESSRLTWHVAKAESLVFVFHVIRTGKAIDDEDLEKEIEAMRKGFRYVAAKAEAKPEEPGPPKPPPNEPEPRSTLSFDHWRLECVKPLGLVLVPPEKLDRLEKDAGVIAKFEGKDAQTRILVRIYAQSRAAQRFTIDQLATQKLERFEELFAEGNRQPPRRDDACKFPMAERAISLELTGKKATVQTTRWILAQCKNDRQYQIEIVLVGAGDWEAPIKELLDGFRPQRAQ